jgi:hypothetical protein
VVCRFATHRTRGKGRRGGAFRRWKGHSRELDEVEQVVSLKLDVQFLDHLWQVGLVDVAL